MRDSIRKMVKLLAAWLAFYSGFLSLYLYLRRKLSSLPDFTILMYHRVLGGENSRGNHFTPGMVTLEDTFEKQMKFLKAHYSVISLDALIGFLANNKKPPPGSIIITFDDGWRDNYLFALPVLKKYGLPATIFLCTDYVGTSRMFWFQAVDSALRSGALTTRRMTDILNRLEGIRQEEKKAIVQCLASTEALIEKLKGLKPELQEKIVRAMTAESDLRISQTPNRRWMLNWEEIEEMGRDQISFGSHANSHRILTHLNVAEVEEELIRSKRTIEERTRKQASSFAYPNGDYTPQIRELVKEAGYLGACAARRTGKKRDEIDRFALPRTGIHEGMSAGVRGKFSKALFACRVAGLLIRRRG
jgi:peptidoglycan/xylan/chitin deacetylase (PgdA/CDA1 family)